MFSHNMIENSTQMNQQPWSFSQPAIRSFSQQIPSAVHTGVSPNSQYQRPFRDLLPSEALTRFYSQESISSIIFILSNVLEQMVVPFKVVTKSNKISFNTVDRRKCPLTGDIVFQNVGLELRLVYFRKSKVISSLA